MYKIYNKNCADMSEVDDESIQMILTVPNPVRDFSSFIPVLHECYRVLKKDGVFFFNVGHPMEFSSMGQRRMPFGFMAQYPFRCAEIIREMSRFCLASDIILIKEKKDGFNPECYITEEFDKILFPMHEHLLMFVKSDAYILNKTFVKHGKYLLNDVWTFNTELDWDDILNDSEKLYDLPQPFDKKIVEYCIRLTTKEGDIILDPYGGTGTLNVVAEQLGRNSIMYEIEDCLCKIAERRIERGL